MRRERGFTLLEMVISVLILSVAMMIASSLLLEARGHLHHASSQLLEPLVDSAVEQIRADLRASSSISAPLVPGWSRDPLILLGHPAGVLIYEKRGERLYRRISTGGPARRVSSEERLVLEQVTTWRWRQRGNAVEVDLGHRRLGHLRRADGRPESVQREVHRVFWTTPRGAGGRRW